MEKSNTVYVGLDVLQWLRLAGAMRGTGSPLAMVRGLHLPALPEQLAQRVPAPGRLYFQCSACRYQCSLVSGTVFVMRLREDARQLTGRVEIDDAYLGGEVQGGKPGRGSPNKVPFVDAVQATECGQPVTMCLSQRPFTKESIQAFAQRSLAAPATLVSDDLGCFMAVQGMGVLHEPHVTGGGAASAVHPSFQAVSTVHQDVPGRHLPCVRIQEVRPSASRPNAVPVQSPLRPSIAARQACPCSFAGPAVRLGRS